MDICPVCVLPMHKPLESEHMVFHKRHGHHYSWCPSMYFTGVDNPPNPCGCPMLSVSAY